MIDFFLVFTTISTVFMVASAFLIIHIMEKRD